MKRLLFASAVLSLTLIPLTAQTPTAPKSAMTQPSLSPDGRTIAFAAGSAIWTVPSAGGAAHLLIADDATASRPLYSPDGRWLAFDSTRTGGGDVYLFELATGQLQRLTYDDGMDALVVRDLLRKDGLVCNAELVARGERHAIGIPKTDEAPPCEELAAQATPYSDDGSTGSAGTEPSSAGPGSLQNPANQAAAPGIPILVVAGSALVAIVSWLGLRRRGRT